MVERQWNAANEEQAEARFTRIGSVAETVDVTYMVARKTYDEAQAKLIEKKREIHHEAIGESVADWKDSDFMRELKEIMLAGKV
jgi:SNF2 family DNA or RNA helicase